MVTYDNAKTDAYGIAQFIMSKSDGAGSIPPFALKVCISKLILYYQKIFSLSQFFNLG